MSDHVLHLGDCLDPLRGLATLADKSADHVICDPPYSEHVHGNSVRNNSYGSGRAVPMAREIGFESLTDNVMREAAREVSRVSARWVVVFAATEHVGRWFDALEANGLERVRAAAWVKGAPSPQFTGDRPAAGIESLVIAHRPGKKRWNAGGKAGVWYAGVPGKGGGKREHPTEKPLDLMQQLISDFTDPGELICDPFAGSGTTGVACKRLGRRFIGWEKDATFWERAVRRLENTKQQYELLPRGPKPKQTRLLP